MSRLLYLVATGYSGSTLLAFLLNAHPQIASVGEATGPFDLWEDQRTYPCSCGKILADCEFWRRISAEMETRGVAFGPGHWDLRFRLARSRVPYQLLNQPLRHNALDELRDRMVLRVPRWRTRLTEIARRNEAFVESVLAVTGKQIFFDASKAAARARYFHTSTGLDLRVVHLVRDSLGFVCSWASRGNSVASGLRHWNRTVGHADRLAALLPSDRFLRVRYEDLCRDTDAELGRIARFAGVEPHPGPIDFRDAHHHMIGSEMRLENSGQVRIDERWRERLTADQIREIERWSGRNRQHLGYR
ncbi:MAG: sulfotransferase [Myxococcota bacterium]